MVNSQTHPQLIDYTILRLVAWRNDWELCSVPVDEVGEVIKYQDELGWDRFWFGTLLIQ